jgi:hypothetical protein
MGSIFGGGFAPIIAGALLVETRTRWPSALHGRAVHISLISVFLLAETHKRET